MTLARLVSGETRPSPTPVNYVLCTRREHVVVWPDFGDGFLFPGPVSAKCGRSRSQFNVISLAMKSTTAREWAVASAAFACLVMTVTLRAEDVYETLVVGTNNLKNVRVIQASPVDLLLGHDDGFKRVKLQDIPESLKAKYPYDAEKEADFERKKADEARARRTQDRAAVRASLLAKEDQIRAQIKPLETELKRLNQNIGVQDRRKQGKGVNSADRKLADEMRARKMQVRDRLWSLRDELEKTETLRKRYD
jgi:hypothetical protein